MTNEEAIKLLENSAIMGVTIDKSPLPLGEAVRTAIDALKEQQSRDGKMKIYISGKITGNPDYKRQFADAADYVRKRGDIPLNPAELPQGMTPSDYMRICFAMVDSADEVLMIYPEWQDSPGARIEKAYAEYIGKKIFHFMTKE